MKKNAKVCFLCGQSASKVVGSLIEGAHGMVCPACIKRCTDIYAAREPKPIVNAVPHPAPEDKLPTPQDIKGFLDQYVVGQDHTKKVLSVAVYQHYSRIFKQNSLPKDHPLSDVELTKSNILMVGPSGTGKTLLAQTLAKFLKVPFTSADCTTMTEYGYVGNDPDICLQSLYAAAEGNLAKVQNGMIYLDEFDKVARKSENMSITRDVSGEGVQTALLRMIEGSVVNMSLSGARKHPQAETIKVDTSNILFICGGAFVGLDDIIHRRMKGRSALGFGAKEVKDDISKIQPQDLIKYGMIPEIIGRLPVVAKLEALSEDDLVHVLTKPRNAIIQQYKKMLAIDGSELIVEKAAIVEMAKIAIAKGTGARALRSVFEDIMMPIMFDLKVGSKVIINRDMVLDTMGLDAVA